MIEKKNASCEHRGIGYGSHSSSSENIFKEAGLGTFHTSMRTKITKPWKSWNIKWRYNSLSPSHSFVSSFWSCLRIPRPPRAPRASALLLECIVSIAILFGFYAISSFGRRCRNAKVTVGVLRWAESSLSVSADLRPREEPLLRARWLGDMGLRIGARLHEKPSKARSGCRELKSWYSCQSWHQAYASVTEPKEPGFSLPLG